MNESNSLNASNKYTECNSIERWYFIPTLILSVSIIVVNILVLLLFIIKRRYLLLSAGNVMLFSLAINDLAAGISMLIHVSPHYLATDYCTMKEDYKRSFIGGYIISKLCLLSTVGHLVILSFDRLFAVTAPIKHRVYFTRNISRASLFIVWTIAIVLPLFELWQVKMDLKIYSTSIIILFFVLPLSILLHQYFTTWIYIRKRMRTSVNREQSDINIRVIILYLVMLIMFILTIVPYAAIRLISAFDESLYNETPALIYELFFFLRYVTSFLNPLVYTLYKRDLQNAVKSLLFKNKKATAELEMTFIRQSNNPLRKPDRKSHVETPLSSEKLIA